MAGFLNRLGNELKKPGGAFRLPGFLGAEAGSRVGNKIMGNKQTSTPTTPTVQTTQRKQVQTYNPRYLGFDEEDYLRLEQLVDQQGVTGSKKAQLMDAAYQYYYPQVLNKHKLDERQEMINQWTYDNGEKLANGDKVTNAKYRLLSLTQMAKEKFDIAYNVEDAQIIDSIKEKVPNGEKLLTDFLNTGNPEILYASGIYDKGQQAQDFRSQKDIANSVLGGNFWKNAWNNMYANSFAPLDSAEKFIYRGIKNAQMLGTKIDDYFADKNLPEGLRKDAFGDKTAEQIRAENQQFRDTARREIDDYIGLVNDANQRNRASTVNPIVDNYYQRRNFTDLLAEGDIDGFFYKGLGDAASNRDMPVIIGASIVNPAMGTALMGTNSYVRESEEAYETMRRAGATHEQAEVGAGVVGLVNSAIEVYLDKMLGGTETTASTGIRDAIKKNVMKEVTNKPFEEIVSSATKTYVGSSLEEGLEEWLQNIVTNAAEMTVKENPEWKDLFKGGRAAAEGGIFNPLNILVPGGDIARNTDINTVKQSMIDGAYNLGETTSNVIDFAKSPWEGTQEFFLERANRKVQNMNRMTKGQQEKFHDMTGQDAGEYMNKRNYRDMDDVGNAFINNLSQVDNAMESIEGTFKSKELDNVMNDVIKYATETEDLNLGRLQELYNKNAQGGLTMAEINEVKRFYERTNIFDYLKSQQSKKARKSTNRDTALREWQYKIAEENGLDNLHELNKETQALKYLLDNASGWQTGIKGNNDISLTDWIVAAGGGLSPSSIASLVGKQIYQSSWFQNKLVDVYNYLGGREYEAGPTVDMSKIEQANDTKREQAKQDAINRALLAAELSKVKNKQEFDAWLKRAELLNPALPYNPEYDNQSPIDYTTPTRVTPEGTATRYGQIGEENNTTPNYKNNENVVANGDNSQKSVYSNDEMNNNRTTLSSNQTDMAEKFNTNDGADYIQAQTEWYEDRRHDLQNGEEWWTDYTDESNQVTEEEHLEWVRNRVKEISKNISEDKISELEDTWNNLGEDEKLEEVKKYRKATADWGPAGEIEDTDEENDFSDQGWIDPNIDEEVKEVDIREVIQKDSMPKKGVSIEKQLRQVENNNVISADEWKKEFIFERYSDDNLRNELKIAKKRYKEFSKKWQEEGGYYNRDQAANYLNKIDAIENMLNDHANSPVGKVVKSYTAEELGLPPVSKAMLKNLDTSKYVAIEDPNTKEIRFFKVEDFEFPKQ